MEGSQTWCQFHDDNISHSIDFGDTWEINHGTTMLSTAAAKPAALPAAIRWRKRVAMRVLRRASTQLHSRKSSEPSLDPMLNESLAASQSAEMERTSLLTPNGWRSSRNGKVSTSGWTNPRSFSQSRNLV